MKAFKIDKESIKAFWLRFSLQTVLVIVLSMTLAYNFLVPLVDCKFTAVDVPHHLVDGYGEPTDNEFKHIISDIYYQHLDEYQVNDSRFIYLIPNFRVTHSGATVTYQHGVSEDSYSLRNIDGATFEARRGVEFKSSKAIVAFNKLNKINTEMIGLMRRGIDIFHGEGAPSDSLFEKMLVLKGFQLAIVICSSLSLFGCLVRAVKDAPPVRYVLAGLLGIMSILILGDMSTRCSIHASAKYRTLPLYILNALLYVAFYVCQAWELVKENVAADEGAVSSQENNSKQNSPGAISIKRLKDPILLSSNDTGSIDSEAKGAPRIDMINNSSSSAEKRSRESLRLTRKKARRMAISHSKSQSSLFVSHMSAGHTGSSQLGKEKPYLTDNMPHLPAVDMSSSKYSSSAVAESGSGNPHLNNSKSPDNPVKTGSDGNSATESQELCFNFKGDDEGTPDATTNHTPKSIRKLSNTLHVEDKQVSPVQKVFPSDFSSLQTERTGKQTSVFHENIDED
ncbi:hypothetical protein CJJ07_003978 [Candidozyma auris]|nr:hypothetical protein CJJ07_003978 [[Candida] auris]QEL61306.1 hypothetical protein CJJ09_003445 [[Candida] auris]